MKRLVVGLAIALAIILMVAALRSRRAGETGERPSDAPVEATSGGGTRTGASTSEATTPSQDLVIPSWSSVSLSLRMFPAPSSRPRAPKGTRTHSSLLSTGFHEPDAAEADRLKREMYALQAIDHTLLKAIGWPFRDGAVRPAYFERCIAEVEYPSDLGAVRARLLACLQGDVAHVVSQLPPEFRTPDIDFAMRARAAIWLGTLECDDSARQAIRDQMDAADPALRASAAAALLRLGEDDAARAWFARQDVAARKAFLGALQPDSWAGSGPASLTGPGWAQEVLRAYAAPADDEERTLAATALVGQIAYDPRVARVLADAVIAREHPATITAILHHYPHIAYDPGVGTSLLALAHGGDRRVALAALATLLETDNPTRAATVPLLLRHMDSDDLHLARLAVHTIGRCVEDQSLELAIDAVKRGVAKHGSDARYKAHAEDTLAWLQQRMRDRR